VHQDVFSVSTGFLIATDISTPANDNWVSKKLAKAATMQLIDLREATNTLNAYSTSIIGKTRLYEQISKPGVPEEIAKIVEELITNLQAETKGAMIISIMVTEEVTRHPEQIVAGFPTELAELSKALSRNYTATDEANKIMLAHKERLQRKEPMENPVSKAIREFREKHG
jgi:hypothetical protein